MNAPILRMATLQDAPAILEIYRPFVETSPVTFEYAVPALAEFERRVQGILAAYPYLVAEGEGRVVGFAYASRHKERQAYGWNAELSVYLSFGARGQGLAGRLYQALFHLLSSQGIVNVYAHITLPNLPSTRLHERLGFARVGVLAQTGFKLGGWHDVAIYEKSLGAPLGAPRPVLPISELPEETVRAALSL